MLCKNKSGTPLFTIESLHTEAVNILMSPHLSQYSTNEITSSSYFNQLSNLKKESSIVLFEFWQIGWDMASVSDILTRSQQAKDKKKKKIVEVGAKRCSYFYFLEYWLRYSHFLDFKRFKKVQESLRKSKRSKNVNKKSKDWKGMYTKVEKSWQKC